MKDLKVNLQRLKNNLLELGDIANSGNRGYTRLAYSDEEHQALNWLKNKLYKLNVTVTQDNIGNVYGRWGDDAKPSVAFGSHLDTVPEGGLYDGALGVVAGLECLQTLMEYYDKPKVPLELACFVGEEANPLGGTFGSRAVSGLIPRSMGLDQKLKQFGFTWNDVASARKTTNDFNSFLEMHIEQGSLLETNKRQIGIVMAIAGILRLSVRVKGRASHSGTTPMHLRHDALLDASKLVQRVNELAIETNSDIVATVGEFFVSPNAANVVPGEVQLTVEIRGSKWEEMKSIETSIRQWVEKNIEAEISVAVEKHPNLLSKTVQSCIDDACREGSVPYQYMVSGANHDANSLTALTDVGMIFVPSQNGISHHPDEFTSWEDIEQGANIMLHSIIKLALSYDKHKGFVSKEN